MARQLFYIFIVSGLFLLSACSTSTNEMPGDVIGDEYEAKGSVESGDSSETIGLEGEGDLSIDKLGDDSLSVGNVIYFDYNSSEILDESLPIIASAAENLTANPAMQIRLEGHADERGTREYNLALGELRAQTVRKLIMLQGASGDQIVIISYGEEKPAVAGSDESSWQKNRRVEFIY